jgi:hypothetical protein
MKAKNLGLRVASAVFLFVALVHVVRIVEGWTVQVGDYHIRLRMSAVAAVAAFAIGVWLWKLACCDKADEAAPPKA